MCSSHMITHLVELIILQIACDYDLKQEKIFYIKKITSYKLSDTDPLDIGHLSGGYRYFTN